MSSEYAQFAIAGATARPMIIVRDRQRDEKNRGDKGQEAGDELAQ